MMQGYYFCRPLTAERTLAVVADMKSDGPSPVMLRPNRHLNRNDHYLCQFSDIERLIASARDRSMAEHSS